MTIQEAETLIKSRDENEATYTKAMIAEVV